MDEHINAFWHILRPLNLKGNVVISGATAIKAHGLILNREPSDLDIAVYQPTEEQWEHILKGEKAMTAGPYPEQRVFKFENEGFHMDIVVEHSETPDGLLMAWFIPQSEGDGGWLFKIQSIENCIAAKRMYNREKDWRDFQDLKNSNFNMTQPDKSYEF